MKLIPLSAAPLALALLFACGSNPVQKGSCSAIIAPIIKNGVHVYYNISGFDPKNKDCYIFLKTFGREAAMNYKLPVTLHFLDDVPDFQPPNDGQMYGSEALRKKVVLQYLFTAEHTEMIFFDPLGYGTYSEPK